ncbi:hypothetical protein [Pseudomonas sp. MWU13-2100]|uniref:hypothetical protein n=1 Tax=Pseudomonas sp. MWU13-2100 TaxID=2935075 RepID=UPI00200C679D|nr:hypothetical protein [Pseudomonas sp. MWU13-2100]
MLKGESGGGFIFTSLSQCRKIKPEWNLAVEAQAAKIMRVEKVRQLSQPFDAPQYAEQFVALTKKHCKCRSLRIRAKCVITDAEGNPIISKKTKAPKIGWIDYAPEMTVQVA